MKYYLIFGLFIAFISCSKHTNTVKDEDAPSNGGQWLIDTIKMTGTAIKNPFPMANNPGYKTVSNVSVSDGEKVVVFKIDTTIYIYPLSILGIEVINDSLGDNYFAVTYCPKTKTTYVVDRKINGVIHTFAASGLLYCDNLVYYDLETESLWSQMFFKCIHGDHYYESPTFINSFQTTFNIAKATFPNARYIVDYDHYKTQKGFLNDENNYENGDLVFGLVNSMLPKLGAVSVIDYTLLSENGIVQTANDIIIYDKSFDYILAFENITILDFSVTGNFPVILTDNEGNLWDVFGFAAEGPRKGSKLQPSESYFASWWAWQGMFESFNYLEE